MPIDRKDLLVEAERKLEQTPPQKLTKKVDDGGAYINLKNNVGWKKLMEEFVEPKLKLEHILGANNDDLPIVRARMQVLKELVDFVDKKVDDAVKAFETLQKKREDNK